jgi:hypothetical protein
MIIITNFKKRKIGSRGTHSLKLKKKRRKLDAKLTQCSSSIHPTAIIFKQSIPTHRTVNLSK